MTITMHEEVIQGSDEWLALRRGILTASEMKLIITPTLKIANNDKSRSHLYELLSQRISGYVEPGYVSDDMLRGYDDEDRARQAYTKHYAPARQVGFVTNDEWGFVLGYSPDALVGDDGQIECKSRRQKFQIETIIADEVPADYMIQLQTGLLVTGRKWCDFISYCGGLPMFTKRVLPDGKIQAAILDAAAAFYDELFDKYYAYNSRLHAIKDRLIPTERVVIQPMHL